MESFNKRLLTKKPRKKQQPKPKCNCDHVGKYTDGANWYCDKCLKDNKVIH